ncbi:mannose-6-phosphate isomerase, class I [Vibrio parahaemolyticus]|uniref:Mannose-6-phosphate isomerase n=1 Tax=Vibrio parahaemolyticus TaxID=670 RepID=A0A7M1W4P4_VIBPH|nr:mannose-6-phosphate isomerase, class I [Vibrio parahaemolyticus]QOS22017.1 mannose-6-phosphate isomerase [Vibrio parahaemolyticus]HCH6295774.1 mannose-6-phosphate isomerase, class I [Vibrio parahaemolyticus]
MNFFKLKNPIQNYAWGSKTAIQDLFGIENPNQEPQAEIWMGAHPNGCSKIELGGKEVLLSEFINNDRARVLSSDTDRKFGELPYLFKVLAVGNALSIQVHPSKQEAEQGFAKEEVLGIERTSFERNYRDLNHKPELVYALTPYQAMNGFRALNEIIELFSLVLEKVDLPVIEGLLDTFKTDLSSRGLKVFFTGILSLKSTNKESAIRGLIDYATMSQQPNMDNDLGSLILELEQCYPNDIGLFAPLMLNVLTLKPGQAMYLDARTPHAYLKGAGLEIMANSDNVLRAGLTSKHIDVEELARCTSFEEKPKSSLLLQPEIYGNKQSYLVPVSDFRFDFFVKADDEKVNVASAEILFAIDNKVTVSHASGESLTIGKGESLFIPAYAKKYSLTSKGRVVRAYN